MISSHVDSFHLNPASVFYAKSDQVYLAFEVNLASIHTRVLLLLDKRKSLKVLLNLIDIQQFRTIFELIDSNSLSTTLANKMLRNICR